jgi:hypothetical protein
MSINSIDMFKKVVIENRYELCDCSNQLEKIYGVNLRGNESDGYTATKWATYNEEEGFSFAFHLSWYGDEYQGIINFIKSNCTYYKIINSDGSDFVAYSCSDSRYRGKIGFMTEDNYGYIYHFPSE